MIVKWIETEFANAHHPRLLTEGREGKSWKVVLIAAGWSLNGRYYPKEVLKAHAKLFEGAKAYAFTFNGEQHFDHLPNSARTVQQGFARNLAGWYENVKYETLPTGKMGLTADFNVTDEKIRETLANAWKFGKKDLLGFSIDAEGELAPGVAEGRRGAIVKDLTSVNSVDIVSTPAAGGKLMRLVASIQGGENTMNKLIAFLRDNPGSLGEGIDLKEKSDGEVMSLLKAALFKKMGKDDETDEEKKKKIGEQVTDQTISEIMVQPGVLNRVVELLKANKVSEALGVITEMLKKTPAKAEAKEGDTVPPVVPVVAPVVPAAPVAPVAPVVAPAAAEVKPTEAETRVAKLETKLEVRESLQASKLPQITKDKITKRFEGAVATTAVIRESITAEQDYLASLDKSGDVKLKESNSDRASVILTESDRMQKSLDLMIDPELKTDKDTKDAYKDIPEFEGPKQAWITFTGDTNLRGRLSESRLAEGATSADFPFALGTSMNRRMIREYRRQSHLWRQLVSVTRVDNFKLQEVIRTGGFGDLAIVAEDASYTELTTPNEERATYTPVKRGKIFRITREMVINDDLRAFRKIPKDLGFAAARTLAKFVWDLLTNYSGGIINGGTVYTGGALYTSGQNNLTTDALAYDSLNTAIDEIMEQTEKDSGEPLGIAAKFLVVPVKDLRSTAESIINSKVKPGATNGEVNTLQNALTIVPVSKTYLRDSNNWFVVADPKTCETIEIGFVQGRQDPEIFIQDGATIDQMFSRDRISYKVRHEYSGNSIDYRGVYAGIVAGS